jgi:hypothetical protein
MRVSRPLASAACGCLAALLLAGCVPDSGGAVGTLERGLDGAASATATARLALDTQHNGRLTPGAAGTAIGDALTALGEEQTALAAVEVETPREREQRIAADQAVAAADQAIKDARSASSGAADIRIALALRRLDDAHHGIEAVRARLERESGDRS